MTNAPMQIPPHAPVLDGGFANPARDSQRVFRVLMDAFAHPGTAQMFKHAVAPPTPLGATAAAVALCLVDADTPLWLDPALAAAPSVTAWLDFHTGAPRVSDPAEAVFALVSAPAIMPGFDAFSSGTQDYPDRSATLILQLETLTDGDAITLAGPGIASSARLSPGPLPRHFHQQWQANRQKFPRGIDLVLAAPDALAAMPRSVRIADGG